VADVTTDLEIQLLQSVAVLGPEMGPTLTGVVSGQAPDQTVGPGIWYVVVQGALSEVVLVEQ